MATDPKDTPASTAASATPESAIAKPGLGAAEAPALEHLDAYRLGQKRKGASQVQPEQISDANAKSFISKDNFQIDQSVDDAFNSIGAVENSGKRLTDKHGNVYRRSGEDVAIRSKDGSTTYIKKGDQQELASDTSEQLYNAKTLDAVYRDRATGTEIVNSKRDHTFEMRTVGGGDTRVAVDSEGQLSKAIGKQFGYDKNHNPQLTENIGGHGVNSQIVLGQGESGQTKITVHTADFSVEREGDQYRFFDMGGVAITDESGRPVSLTKKQLSDLLTAKELSSDKLKELGLDGLHIKPSKLAALRAKLGIDNADSDALVFNGVKIHRDGYEHDRTTVLRDRETGSIKATTLNADHQGHDEIDTIDRDHANVRLMGVFNTEIKDGKAVTRDADQKAVSTYDYATGTYTTKDATFSSKGTDVKFAGAHVDANSGAVSNTDGSKADAGSPAAVAVTASAADASASAQALAARATADAKSASNLSGAIDASYGKLAALAGACQDNSDALQYIQAGLAALDSAYGALGIPVPSGTDRQANAKT
jgi:hypothetical protein